MALFLLSSMIFARFLHRYINIAPVVHRRVIFTLILTKRHYVKTVCFLVGLCFGIILKPMHNIGKVSVNASILHKNQEMCNKTNLWKFQLVSLFLLRENSTAFSMFVFILMAGVFVSSRETKTHYWILFHKLFENDSTSGRHISRKAFYHRYLYTM